MPAFLVNIGWGIVDFFESFVLQFPGTLALGLIWGVLALGVYITFKILDFADMTVDGSICTGGAVAVMLIAKGVSPYIALICAFASGCIAGAVTAFLHTVLKIPGILAGILTQLALYSINIHILGNQANQPIPYDTKVLVSAGNTTESILVATAIIIGVLAILYWVFGTELGCATRATGCNPNMARAQGINTNVTKLFGLVLANGLVAFSGALYVQYLGSVDVKMGKGAIVIGLAAVVIGEVIFGARHGFIYKMFSVVMGTIIYYTVQQLATEIGLSSEDMKLVSAITVAIFLAIPNLKGKVIRKSPKKGESENA